MGPLIASVFVLGSLLFSVGVDVRNNENDFAKSYTGQKLKEYGGYEYGLLAYEHAADITNKTAVWAVENVPIYVATTVELSKTAFNVSRRAYHNLSGFFSEKFPDAENYVQEKIPVVKESIYTAMDATKKGAGMVIDAARTHGANGANYLRNEVFVGEWSPENLQKHTKRAYDSTHNLAVNTASWVMDKVRSFSDGQH